MFTKYIKITIVALVALFTAGLANAASLSVVGGIAYNLDAGFGLGASTGLGNGSSVIVFADGVGGGLSLVGSPANIVMEYLGSSSNSGNDVYELVGAPGVIFNSLATPLFSKASVNLAGAGLIPFAFGANNASVAINGGFFSFGHAIAFAVESPNSVIALFDEGDGIFDLDDMAIRISVIPLPASFWMFGAALVGLAVRGATKKRSSKALQAV